MNIVFAFQDICTVVPHWIRYKELIAILEASLQDIVDRWADGKVLANFFFSFLRGFVLVKKIIWY